jgi:hypothetical protein
MPSPSVIRASALLKALVLLRTLRKRGKSWLSIKYPVSDRSTPRSSQARRVVEMLVQSAGEGAPVSLSVTYAVSSKAKQFRAAKAKPKLR